MVRTPDPIDVTVVGVATFAGTSSQGSATFAGFTTDFAEQVLLPRPGQVSSIAVAAAAGVDEGELVDRLETALPDDVETITGTELIAELEEQIQGEDSETLRQALILFAFVALVVGAFSIHNTFSILMAQRTRESALLRALGASRAQVLRSLAGEALAVGLVGSAAGIAVGLLLAWGLLAFMKTLGQAAPAGPLVLDAATVAAALVVGVVVTLLASLTPAVRASRIAPLAALRDVAVDRSATSGRRAVVGALLTGAGVVLAVAGGVAQALVLAGLGSFASLVGVVVLGPVAARPAALVLGAPQAAWGGVSGELARRNTLRDPRRTAATATSLMIGVAVVSLFTVIAASLTQWVANSIHEQFIGDVLISGEGQGGLSTDLAAAVAALPEVAVASPHTFGPARVDGQDTLVSAIDPATIGSVIDLDVRQGSLSDLRLDEVIVSVGYADEHRLQLGDGVTVEFADGTTGRLTVGAIYANDDLTATGGIALHRDTYLAHTSRPVDTALFIELAEGVDLAAGEAAVQAVADRFGAPDAQTADEFADTIAGEISVLLNIVYVLLVIAIVIALLNITNTLSLSIHERTRELGLLRAVGQTRRQTRAMVRGEAVIVALFGTLGGVALGVFLAWALVSALAGAGELGPGSFTLPTMALAVTLALGALAGLAAAARPARRAANLDVLAAIATE